MVRLLPARRFLSTSTSAALPFGDMIAGRSLPEVSVSDVRAMPIFI
jgi:hypothetical protein